MNHSSGLLNIGMEKQAFGVYVHWPFCAAKCPYCDFNSHVRHKPVDQHVFVEAYMREITHMAAMAPGRKVTSIFFGGGTPSLMEPKTVSTILEAISNHWSVASDAEITLEANPSSVEAERFRHYRTAGVNRVSMGVQSFHDDQLKFLGRLHSVAEAEHAIELAREIFPRISFDLIYARPGQTMEAWRQELHRALQLAADHLSLYQLTIEEGTPFFELYRRKKFAIPDQDLAADLYELTRDMTEAHGMPAYEISNHASVDAQCRHNLVYWRYQDYAGIGPGAHGRLTTNEGKTATVTERNPEIWWQKTMVDGHGLRERDVLDAEATGDEFLVMGLRLAEGIDPVRYEAFSGKSLSKTRIDQLVDQGFLEETDLGRLKATPTGFLVLDAVVADLAIDDHS